MTGSLDALTNWSPDNALALSSANYPTWSSASLFIFITVVPTDYFLLVTINLPASTAFQYKYVRVNNGAVTWESDPNVSATTPASGSYTLNDTWR